MSVKKIISYKGYKGTFEVGEPIRGKLSKNKLDRVDEGRLKVTKGEGCGMGVLANLGTKANRRKRTIRLGPNVVEDVSPKWGDEGDRVVVKVDDAGDKAKEILLYELFGWYPKLLSAVVDDLVLVQVTVDSEGTGGGMEEIREEICYRYL